MKRIHVVGCPRSGTTLALEALVNGFAIDGHALEERTFLTGMRKPDDSYAVFCSKKPGEHRYAPYLLERQKSAGASI